MSFVGQAGQKAVSRLGKTIRARREKRDALRPQFCLNCGAEARKFCPECGQENTPHAVHIGELFRDVWDEFIKADNKFFRTMIPLLFRPGVLTRHYVEGKRSRYLPPFRMYLVVSAVFFTVFTQNATPKHLGRSVTLGQKIAEAEKKAEERKAAAGKAPALVHTHPKKPPKEVNFTFDDNSHLPSVIHFAGRSLDWRHVPETWADYAKTQADLAKTTPEKCDTDDLVTRWAVERVIKVKSFTAQSYFDHLLDTLPKVMFVMMPVFALLLKILYFRSPRRYVEHFVLALHVHTVYFMVSGLSLLLPIRTVVAAPIIILYMAFYGLWAMRTVYGQGLPKTFLKWLLLTWNYGFALQIGFVLALLLSFLL